MKNAMLGIWTVVIYGTLDLTFGYARLFSDVVAIPVRLLRQPDRGYAYNCCDSQPGSLVVKPRSDKALTGGSIPPRATKEKIV
jgi:hypothetical protein